MPFVFLVVGAVFITAGVRGQSANLLTLLKGDFTGSNNFIYWFISIVVVGAVGYVKDLQALSRAFLVLVIIVLLLNEDKNGQGFFTEIQAAISSIFGSGYGVNVYDKVAPISTPSTGNIALQPLPTYSIPVVN
jgi:hypothetical protein